MRALALLAVAGCASYGTMTTARTLPPGTTQATAALELDGAGVVEDDARIPSPTLAVAVRRGVARDLDVGAKLSVLPLDEVLETIGVEAQARWRFRGDASRRLELAVAPTAGWRGVSSSGARWDAAHAVVPVIVGLNLGARRHQLFLSPKVGWQRWWSAGAMPVDLPFAGAGIGFAWRVRDDLTLVPELSALQSPTSLRGSDGMALVHLGIGLVWDGK